jgi:hypothetical protein
MAVKLKGFNFKSLILKHGEKLILVVVGGLVLFALAATKWMPYDGHPLEITNAVQEAQDVLDSKTWPDAEQEKYTVAEGETVADLVASVRQQVDPTDYLFTQSFRFDLNETTSPIAEPKFEPVQALVADADRMVIYVSPEPTDWYTDEELMAQQEGTEETEQPADEEADVPDAFKTPVTQSQAGGFGQYPGVGRGQAGGMRLPPGFDPSMFDPSMLQGIDPSLISQFTGGAAGRQQGPGRRGRQPAGQGRPGTQAPQGRRGRQPVAPVGPGAAAAAAMAGGMGLGMGDEEYMYDEFGGMGMGGFGAFGGSEGRGLRYVAVRGAFPLRDQLEEIKKASNLNTLYEAEQFFHIIDFELQRKRLLADAEDPWSGEWQKVDIEVAKKILLEAGGFEPEMHEGIVTDAGMTMPLPQRAMGIYGKHATHPDLEEFKLSDEEMDLEMQIMQKLLQEHLKLMENQPEELVTKRGWSEFVHDSRSMMTSLRGAGGIGGMGGMGAGFGDYAYEDDMGMYDDMSGMGAFGGMGAFAGFAGGRGIGGQFQPLNAEERKTIIDKIQEAADDEEKKKLLREHIAQQISAEGEMLLYRYLDFDVEPGETYKYRVRLEVTNPNFGRRSAEAGGHDFVVEGQTRFTDWSNETEPVYVPHDVDYFVEKVETRSGDPMRVKANLTLFQWDPEVGSTVTAGDLEVEVGDEIGGYGNPFVLDPAMYRFEIQENYQFQTGDLIVDAAFVDSINPGRHPDLQLPNTSRRDTGVSDQVLVVRNEGELAIIDEKSRLKDLELRKQYLEFEQRNFADIKGLEAKQAGVQLGTGVEGLEGMEEFGGVLGGIYGDDGGALGAAMGLGGDDRSGRGRRGNLLRKARSMLGGRR